MLRLGLGKIVIQLYTLDFSQDINNVSSLFPIPRCHFLARKMHVCMANPWG